MLLIHVFNPSLEGRGASFPLHTFTIAYLICHGDADLAYWYLKSKILS